MDACLHKFETSIGSMSIRPTSSEKAAAFTRRRVAHWDHKREKCNNCELIYLKTLSQHLGFCSVDCKSNMVYLDKVNRTIRAMKDAVDERHSTHEQVFQKEPTAQQEPHPVEVDQSSQTPMQGDVAESNASHSSKAAQSFAEFGVESRVIDASNVKWSFSAVY